LERALQTCVLQNRDIYVQFTKGKVLLDMGVGRGAGGLGPPVFESFRKKGCFLSFVWEKTNFTTLGLPLEKRLEKSTNDHP